VRDDGYAGIALHAVTKVMTEALSLPTDVAEGAVVDFLPILIIVKVTNPAVVPCKALITVATLVRGWLQALALHTKDLLHAVSVKGGNLWDNHVWRPSTAALATTSAPLPDLFHPFNFSQIFFVGSTESTGVEHTCQGVSKLARPGVMGATKLPGGLIMVRCCEFLLRK